MIMEKINVLGSEGWEMVGVLSEIGGYAPASRAGTEVASMLMSPVGSLHSAQNIRSYGHSLWFKRPKN